MPAACIIAYVYVFIGALVAFTVEVRPVAYVTGWMCTIVDFSVVVTPVAHVTVRMSSTVGGATTNGALQDMGSFQSCGTMCGVLESNHQVRAPPARWAELEVPLRAGVRDGDVLLAGNREPTRRGAWIGRNCSCISRHNCCKTSTPGHSSLGFRKGTFAQFSSPSLFWAFLAGYVQDTKGLETFVLIACFHWSNPSVSWIREFVGVAKLGTSV